MSLQRVRKKYIHNFFYAIIILAIVISLWFRIIRVNESIGLSGVVKSRNIEVIKSPCDTYLKEIYVIPGEEVRQGQLLARLDGIGIRNYLQDINAKIVEADNRKTDLAAKIDITPYQISVIEQNIIQCRIKLETAQIVCQDNEKLLKNGVISGFEFQQSKNEVITLQAELVKQENNLKMYKRQNDQAYKTSVKDEIDFLNQQVQEYKRILAAINRQFRITDDYSGNPSIIAPCNGIVTAIGDSAINQNDSQGTNTVETNSFEGKAFTANETILEISNPNDIYIEGDIRENDFPYVSEEDKVFITFAAYPYQRYGVFEGIIAKLYREPTFNLRQTQYKCEIRLFNIKSNLKVKMYSGLNAYIAVDTRKNYNLLEYMRKKMFENTTR